MCSARVGSSGVTDLEESGQNHDMSDAAERGRRLREAREARGLGVRELSRRAGLDGAGADVSRIENGKQRSPSYDKIRALAAVLGVAPEWLWSGEGEREATNPRPEPSDPLAARSDAIARMRGAVCDEAIAMVRAAEIEELVRADRLVRRRRAAG